MNNQLLDLLTRLDNRSGQDAAYIETKNFFESLGFNYVNIVLASYKDGPLGMFTNMGAEWLSHYVDQGYHECDLIIDLVADQDVMRLCDPVSNLALPTRDRPKTDKMLAE
ncbi:MAG: autoinducer binding domain-containing protein, partial [Pseudomonadota bacterium]